MTTTPPFSLSRHEEVFWTHDALDHAALNAAAYGVGDSVEDKKFIAEERERIDAGRPTRRNGPNTRVYLVEVDGAVHGEVVVSNLRGTPEVDVAVYRGDEGQGIGTAALSQVVDTLHAEGHRKVRARIRLSNPNIERVGRLLARCGFVRQDAWGGTEEWHHRFDESAEQG